MITDGIPVVVIPIEVASVLLDEHVVGEGVDIEKGLHLGILGRVGHATVGQADQLLVIATGIGAVDGVAGIECVVVVLVTAEVGFAKSGAGSFGGIVETPVDSVDVEVGVN